MCGERGREEGVCVCGGGCHFVLRGGGGYKGVKQNFENGSRSQLPKISVLRIYLQLLHEKCKPHLGTSTSQDQTLVFVCLALSSSSDEPERASSPGHGQIQGAKMIGSYPYLQ